MKQFKEGETITDHLPECLHPKDDNPCKWWQEIKCECPCICERLRDCEQRVIAEGDEQSLIAYSTGYNNTFEVCIAALQAMPTIQDESGYVYIDFTVPEILAAIKTLQQDNK